MSALDTFLIGLPLELKRALSSNDIATPQLVAALSDSPGTLQIASQGSDSHLVGGGTRPGWNAGFASDTAATTVNVTTVDALVRAGRLLPDTPPLVLKVDTQGSEHSVLSPLSALIPD